ncbi:NAD-dependent dehydratase [Methylobacterium sp. Leaf399]|uniref:NAD-dependent epimerase/dehydratase family protein n=1 Tax=Methylobacterium sp. Leaf399 TaxID=1736364 RepID=UPI0007005C06|nr:NAD(P)-dependent oxidoreductase [Methylobacterium sp. Leaf399]KQT19975.1 NAD-dependent dehydratase [Methylobacterium sp. Leaf399]
MTGRVLVTGGSGFVGRSVLPLLVRRGFTVHAAGPDPVDLAGVVGHRIDLLDAAQRRAVVADIRPTHLLHLAWYAEPGAYWTSPKNLDWVGASLDLAQAFAEAGGRRLVAAGTCAEYEWGSERLSESRTPCRPATLYGAAKDGLRRVLAAYAREAGLSFAWGRLFYLYGPGEQPGRLVGDTIRRLLAGERIPTTEGLQRRDFLHVDDAAEALAALLAAALEGPVNVGSGRAVPVREILARIGALTGRADLIGFGERALPPGDPAVIEADVARLRGELGVAPGRDLDEGLAQMVERYRALPPGAP